MLTLLIAQVRVGTRADTQLEPWYVATIVLVGLIVILYMGFRGARERDLEPRTPTPPKARTPPPNWTTLNGLKKK